MLAKFARLYKRLAACALVASTGFSPFAIPYAYGQRPACPAINAEKKSQPEQICKKVQPGLVNWVSDFEEAKKRAALSGKQILVFQMMGKLDDEFC